MDKHETTQFGTIGTTAHYIGEFCEVDGYAGEGQRGAKTISN